MDNQSVIDHNANCVKQLKDEILEV